MTNIINDTRINIRSVEDLVSGCEKHPELVNAKTPMYISYNATTGCVSSSWDKNAMGQDTYIGILTSPATVEQLVAMVAAEIDGVYDTSDVCEIIVDCDTVAIRPEVAPEENCEFEINYCDGETYEYDETLDNTNDDELMEAESVKLEVLSRHFGIPLFLVQFLAEGDDETFTPKQLEDDFRLSRGDIQTIYKKTRWWRDLMKGYDGDPVYAIYPMSVLYAKECEFLESAFAIAECYWTEKDYAELEGIKKRMDGHHPITAMETRTLLKCVSDLADFYSILLVEVTNEAGEKSLIGDIHEIQRMYSKIESLII